VLKVVEVDGNVFVKGVQMSDDVGIENSNWKGTRFPQVLGMEV
jgi:hypothetical protein